MSNCCRSDSDRVCCVVDRLLGTTKTELRFLVETKADTQGHKRAASLLLPRVYLNRIYTGAVCRSANLSLATCLVSPASSCLLSLQRERLGCLFRCSRQELLKSHFLIRGDSLPPCLCATTCTYFCRSR